MDGGPFDDQSFSDYSNQPLPSLSSTLLQNKNNQENINAHSIQMMLGLQQQQDVFCNMNSPLDYKGSSQKLDNSSMHHDLGPMFQQSSLEALNNNSNGVKRKSDDIVLLQSQNLSSTEIPTTTTSSTTKKNDKKKNDNNGVKKKKTRWANLFYHIKSRLGKFWINKLFKFIIIIKNAFVNIRVQGG